METARLPFIKTRKDTGGRCRYYFNRRGSPQIRLHAEPGTLDFRLEYEMAAEIAAKRVARRPAARPDAAQGSLTDLVERYYRSPHFKALRPLTRSTYRNEIEKIRIKHGHKPIGDLDRKGVMILLAEKAATPGAANKLLRTLRMLMGFAISEELRKDDPTAKIKRFKVPGDGFPCWGEREIMMFEKKHQPGTRAHLAFSLLLFTAQRRGDVIRLGRSDIRRNRICLTQSKTGIWLEIPVHEELAAILRAAPVGPETFLTTAKGEAFTPAGFGNWFGDCCRAAGLPVGFNAHGLRKAACRRLAEAGCSPHEIMAISGHKTLAEVERYTRSASQPRLAAEAMRKVAANLAA